jgi:hypothetical protein
MSPVRTAPADLTADDAALRTRYLTEVLDLLYPPPCVIDGNAGPRIADYIVVPDARRPRLLVPSGSRRVSAAAVRRYAEPQSRTGRLKRDAVVATLRTGVSGLLLRDRIRVTGPASESIDGYLRAALGRDLVVSVHIGPARANRKPVLQLIGPDGDTVGFAKLGTGPLTQRLVRAETAALTALGTAGLTELTVPRVLHAGHWRDRPILVQSALPVWLPRAPLTARRLTAAMLDIARCCGFSAGPLAASAYWAELRGCIAAAADRSEGAALASVASLVTGSAGDTVLEYGSWHGDWAPWNMANVADALLVWDWERFAQGVPMGFDAMHHELQQRIQSTPDAAAAVDATVARATDLLAPFGVPAGARELTAVLYLIDLAARYLTDRQAEAGARLGVLGTWLLPVLIRRVEELFPHGRS